MVETRLQERSLTEQVDEICSLHELLAASLSPELTHSTHASTDLKLWSSTTLPLRSKQRERLRWTHVLPTQRLPTTQPHTNHHTLQIWLDTTRSTTTTSPTTQSLGVSTLEDVPAFDGTQLHDGISKCEQFFDIDGASPDLKVRLAALHFTDKASEWNHNFMSTRYGVLPSWTEFVVAISSRFSALYDDPLAELVALKQGSDNVINYLDKFETARMRIILPEEHALSIFLANMNTHLSLHTRQFEVITIASAAKIAMLHESSLSHTHSKLFRASFNPTKNQKPYQKHPPSTHLLQTNDAPKPTQRGFIPRNVSAPRKYSYQEMQDIRSKGLCMFCEEPFTSGHQLKHKRSQIFVMECDDDNNSSDGDNEEVVGVITGKDDEPDITPVLSINAING